MKKDYYYMGALFSLLILIPLCIIAYDRSLAPGGPASRIKEFTLTGHSREGWLLGDVKAWDALSVVEKSRPGKKTVIRVSLNDQVVLRLRSADVSHGFSLKAYGIYIPNGIPPGSTRYVRFKADREGTFVFACNVYCGDIHHAMKGTLVVEK